jgi:hypothetical protein
MPDVAMLRAALKEIGKTIHVNPWCLNEAIRLVMKDGWSQIDWAKHYTALHLAAEFGQADVMPLIVALGAKTEDADSKKRTALDVAVKMKHWRCVSMLEDLQNVMRHDEEKIASPETKEVNRLFNAVREATRFMDLEPLCLREAVWHLLVTGSSNIPWYESTVLNLACEFERDDIMPLLFALHADPDAVDALGRTAMDVAEAKGNWSCCYMLKTRGAASVEVSPEDTRKQGGLVRLRSVPPPR